MASLLLAVTACTPHTSHVVTQPAPRITHGPASGEITATSAVLWARCDGAAELTFSVYGRSGAEARSEPSVTVGFETDFTGKVVLQGLTPETEYLYEARCGTKGEDDAHGVGGRFRTAPAPTEQRAVRFAWGGDLGGQNVCRDAREGYAVFDAVRDSAPDFFVALGDLMYADDPCLPQGRYGNAQIAGPAVATDAGGFRAHWRYARDDRSQQKLFSALPYYAVWDDHEIKNDAGPLHDTLPNAPARHLLQPALQAFLEHNPIAPPGAHPARLYRRVRWGSLLELFILDTRQYRDANFAPDDDDKSLLGATQREWLVHSLQSSDATWKVVVCSVPLSIPTGHPRLGHDGWADFGAGDGFERELLEILRRLRDGGVRDLVWITTDVHFGSVFRYRPFPAHPDFVMYELVTGPMNAGVFPRPEVDHTLRPERLFFHGPSAAEAIRSYEEAKHWFNFGVVDVDADGRLAARIVNARGDDLYELRLPEEESTEGKKSKAKSQK